MKQCMRYCAKFDTFLCPERRCADGLCTLRRDPDVGWQCFELATRASLALRETHEEGLWADPTCPADIIPHIRAVVAGSPKDLSIAMKVAHHLSVIDGGNPRSVCVGVRGKRPSLRREDSDFLRNACTLVVIDDLAGAVNLFDVIGLVRESGGSVVGVGALRDRSGAPYSSVELLGVPFLVVATDEHPFSSVHLAPPADLHIDGRSSEHSALMRPIGFPVDGQK